MTDQGGRWVPVVMPDGTERQDWVPDDQPASPDGGPGSWHVVSGGWEWHPRPPPSMPPGPPAPLPGDVGAGVSRSRRTVPILAAVLATVAGVAAVVALGGGSGVTVAGVGTIGESDEKKLKRAVQQSADALASGNFIGLQALQDPVTCTKEDTDEMIGGMALFSGALAGFKEMDMRVVAVEITGDRGRITKVEAGPNATELGRRSIETLLADGEEDDEEWVRRGGRWYSMCEPDETQTMEPISPSEEPSAAAAA
jgi:hypothetical protein